jgi:hypothetical protein
MARPPGLEAEPAVTAPLRLAQEMQQDRLARAPCRGTPATPRIDLSSPRPGSDLAQRADGREIAAVPRRSRRHVSLRSTVRGHRRDFATPATGMHLLDGGTRAAR